MHTQLASGGRIEAVHLKQQPIVMRLIALLLVSVFSLAAPSVSRASFRVVHVFVVLADNQHQGIIPVPPALGNGRDPQRNLYWGAAYGVKKYFKASEDWGLAWSGRGAQDAILERCVFKSSKNDVYLVADAYEGSQIKLAVTDFLSAAAGIAKQRLSLKTRSGEVSIAIAGDADLVVYVGHDAFMDFQIPRGRRRQAPANDCPRVCQQVLFRSLYPSNWRGASVMDDGPHGSGGLHVEGCYRWLDRPRRRPSDSATRRPSLRPIPEVRRSCSAEAVRDKVVKCEGGARRCRRPFTFGSIRRAGLPLRDDRCDVQPQPLRHSGSIRWIGLEEVLDLQLLNALRHAIAQAGDDVVHQPLLRVCRQQPE